MFNGKQFILRSSPNVYPDPVEMIKYLLTWVRVTDYIILLTI